MKKFICIVLLVVLAAGFCVGCKREPTAEEIWESLYDHEECEVNRPAYRKAVFLHPR